MDLSLSPRAEELRRRLVAFMDQHGYTVGELREVELVGSFEL